MHTLRPPYAGTYKYVAFTSPSPKSAEYKSAMETISPIVEDHHKKMKKGEPQLNYCDKAVMVKCNKLILELKLVL